MTDEQKAAFIMCQAVGALIEAMAMQSTNILRAHRGYEPHFIGDDFTKLIEKYGIGHNHVISFFSP